MGKGKNLTLSENYKVDKIVNKNEERPMNRRLRRCGSAFATCGKTGKVQRKERGCFYKETVFMQRLRN